MNALLLPVRDGEGWVWPQLRVATSKEPGAGLGLFARVPLRTGTMIPYIGQPATGPGTHVFQGVDGHPHLDPHRQVGSRGWSVAAMANEPLRKTPRCILSRGCLVVAHPVRAGEELTVYYGDGYQRHYSLAGNRHLERVGRRLDKRRLLSERQVAAAVAAAARPSG